MNARFSADPARCIACGRCVDDCVAGIVRLENNLACVAPEDENGCIGCQHCLGVCPTAAVRVVERDPAASLTLSGAALDPALLDKLVRGRRSIRHFSPNPVPPDVLASILDTTSYAPTGVNARLRRYTVIRDPEVLAQYRDACCRILARADTVPDELEWLADFARAWLDGGPDVLFRTAPHLLVVSVDRESPCADVDGVIALSYFDLVATAHGVGTVWAGMINALLNHFPQCRRLLGIPDNHRVGYAILFGMPAVRYPRAVQHAAEDVRILDRLHDGGE